MHAADADSRHRTALYGQVHVTFWGPNFPLLQVRERPNTDSLIFVDMRHICKRFVRRILGKGWCVNTVHITAPVLLTLSKKLRVGSSLEAALRERDFMSVRAALDVMLALVEIGAFEHVGHLEPSLRAAHAAVRAMHWFVHHTLQYYFQNARPLQDRLLHAAKAALHLLVLQQQTNTLSTPLYVDFQTEYSTVFSFVRFFFFSAYFVLCTLQHPK